MSVITISRQYASGGSDIAGRVARALGWSLIDNAFIDRVAERAGLSPDEVAAREERAPRFIERLARALAASSPEIFVSSGSPRATDISPDPLVHVTEAVISEAVQHGDAVMVGRGAQAYLGKRVSAMHVFVVAARGVRIEAAVERLGHSREEAERHVDGVDDQRRRYVKTHYDREWDNADNYDLVLNSAMFGYEGCANLIVAAAARAGLVPPG